MINTKHITRKKAKLLLQDFHNHPPQQKSLFLTHINQCQQCWRLWNQARWDQAWDSEGFKELKQYLGAEFIEYYDSSTTMTNNWQTRQPQSNQEIIDFYKNNKDYLYSLVIWKESGQKFPYQTVLTEIVNNYQIKSVIDFGAGVGFESLLLAELGCLVFSVDLDCPASRFLKWRFANRKKICNFIDAEAHNKLPEADLLIAIDVLEHLTNPLAFLNRLPTSLKFFFHKSRFGEKEIGRHPFHFNCNQQKFNNKLQQLGFRLIVWHQEYELWIRNH